MAHPAWTPSLCGCPVAVFDAHRGRSARPRGRRTRHGRRPPPRRRPRAHRRRRDLDRSSALPRRRRRVRKLPATTVLADHLAEVPEAEDDAGYREIGYRRDGPVGMLDFRLLQRRDVHRAVPPTARGPAARHRAGHPGAAAARRPALLQRHPPGRHRRRCRPRPPRRGTTSSRSTTCARRSSPASTSWSCASMAGSAGAGGVMLALGADRVLLRAAAVLNPHYRTHGPVRLGVLDLRPASPRRGRHGQDAHHRLSARRRAARRPHRPGRPGLAR